MKYRVLIVLIAIGVLAAEWRWLSRSEPDWPAPERYSTERYDRHRLYPDAPVTRIPTFTCRKREEVFEPLSLEFATVEPFGHIAIEGDVNYPDWSEGTCRVRLYIENCDDYAYGRMASTVATGFDRPHHNSYRLEVHCPRYPGTFRLRLEYEHPVGNPGSEVDQKTPGSEKRRLTTVIGTGTLVVR